MPDSDIAGGIRAVHLRAFKDSSALFPETEKELEFLWSSVNGLPLATDLEEAWDCRGIYLDCDGKGGYIIHCLRKSKKTDHFQETVIKCSEKGKAPDGEE